MSLYTDRPSLNPPLHPFNLSHNHFTTMDFGLLYPVMYQECVAGDIFQLRCEALVRALPLVAPILNNMTLSLTAFFVPNRIIFKDWESFFTGIDQSTIPPQTYDKLLPVWCEGDDGNFPTDSLLTDKTSIWRALGLNCLGLSSTVWSDIKAYLPTDLVRRAYYKIWNDWFRDENFQDPIDFTSTQLSVNGKQQKLMRRAWEKDYFSAALYSRQKGTAPSVPLSLTGSAIFDYSCVSDPVAFPYDSSSFYNLQSGEGSGSRHFSFVLPNTFDKADVASSFNDFLNSNDISGTSAGFTVNDFRDLTALQHQLEGLMIYGSRYIEVLQGVYGTSPTDARLQIAERLGGMTFNVRVSEVLQTSSSTDTSPQGNQTGHALGVSEGQLISYKCEEPGWIIVLADIKPPAVYRNRFPREFFRRSQLEQYSPYQVNLSFQAINNREIFGTLSAQDDGVWAYQGRYDEMRCRMSYVSGQLLDTMEYYLSVRRFSSLPAMNGDFIECNPDDDVFAVTDEDKFICNFYFDLQAMRPLPPVSIPGLVDHVYGR